MNPLRVVAYSHTAIDEALPPGKFVFAGKRNPPVPDLTALDPHVVLIVQDDFDATIALAEQVMQRVPAAAVVVTGARAVDTDKVLTAVRLGVRDVLGAPDPGEIRTALERVWAQHQRAGKTPAAQRGKIVVVYSPKGGSGKSAFAVNLACLLARNAGQELALVDLALDGGDLDLLLDVKPAVTWPDLARCGTFGPEEVEAALTPARHGVRLLAAPPHIEDAELVTVATVERALELLCDRFPYVVVDTASALAETSVRVIELAGHILMPLPLTLSALRRGQRVLRLWNQLGIKPADVTVVAWGQEGDVRVDTARKLLHHPVDFVLPYDPKGIEQAANAGEILALTSPSGAYAKALAPIAADLAGQDGNERTKRASLLGWLGIGDRRKSDVLARKA